MKKRRRAICCASRPTTSTSRSISTARRGSTSAPPPSCARSSPTWKSSRACTTEYGTLDAKALTQKAQPQRNVLAQWVAGRLLANRSEPLAATLDAAMGRSYSASPEPFFTGGGLHHFANFDTKDNGRVMDVWEATRNSVNLVYIRIMRDIVRYYASATPGTAAHILDDATTRCVTPTSPASSIRKA